MSLYNSYAAVSTKSLNLLLEKRSIELFNMCDQEGKGFINKKDIQRMHHTEPGCFTPEMLEEVFEALDTDGNGFLTLDEFAFGFATLFQAESAAEDTVDDEETTSNGSANENSMSHFSIEEHEDDEQVEAEFKGTMEQLGAEDLIKESGHDIKGLWSRLRNEDPEMLKSFEKFLGNISQEINRTKGEFNMLENALQNKSTAYDDQISKLYEEMENQIKSERARLSAQEALREKELKEKVEHAMIEKERILQESISKQIEMERSLSQLNSIEYKQKQENERLMRENALLEEQLMESVKSLEDSKSYINTLKTQSKAENKERVKMAWKNTENIAVERESLVKELEKLREINKNLQDERDELEIHSLKRMNSYPNRRKSLTKQDSVLSNYFPNYKLTPAFVEMDEIMSDPIKFSDAETTTTITTTDLNQQANKHAMDATFQAQAIPTVTQQAALVVESENASLGGETAAAGELSSVVNAKKYAEIMNVPANATPERVFKIVFIGDSGVGKTSFVHRFCNDTFRESFNTTIGVDFQVKLLSIDNKIIALQLWDTAGQERYRSITKQYFRKADGVVCMYDVSSEQSFKSLRQWIGSIRENASEDCLVTIVGNKIDLCEREDHRVVRFKDGEQLATSESCLFFEASSKKDKNVIQTMEAVARCLADKEDKLMEDVLKLNMAKKDKNSCIC